MEMEVPLILAELRTITVSLASERKEEAVIFSSDGEYYLHEMGGAMRGPGPVCPKYGVVVASLPGAIGPDEERRDWGKCVKVCTGLM